MIGLGRGHRLLVARPQSRTSRTATREWTTMRGRRPRHRAPPAPRRCSRAAVWRWRCAVSRSPAFRTSRRSASPPGLFVAIMVWLRSRCFPAVLGFVGPRITAQAQERRGLRGRRRALVPVRPCGRAPRGALPGVVADRVGGRRSADPGPEARVHRRRRRRRRPSPSGGPTTSSRKASVEGANGPLLVAISLPAPTAAKRGRRPHRGDVSS